MLAVKWAAATEFGKHIPGVIIISHEISAASAQGEGEGEHMGADVSSMRVCRYVELYIQQILEDFRVAYEGNHV
jgi:hypothetical protein